MVDRSPRDAQTREAGSRKKAWVEPSKLPDPVANDGYRYRWVRTSAFGNADNTNVSTKFRMGWEPVKAEEHPELMIDSDVDSKWAARGNIEVGGLMLCRMPEELAQSRDEFYAEKAHSQIDSVDANWMREQDRRMPKMKAERSTKTTIGKS